MIAFSVRSPKPTAYTEVDCPAAFVLVVGAARPDANGIKILAGPVGPVEPVILGKQTACKNAVPLNRF